MATEIIAVGVPVATAAIGVAGTLLTQAVSRRTAQSAQARKALSRYRDPLLSAAFELQSRLYNIATAQFLETYLEDPSEDGVGSYAEASSLWLIAQYFGWVEILRRDIQFLDLGLVERNRRIQDCLAAVEREFASDSELLGNELRVFRA